ncbi:hypothetical protein FRC08_005563 [Ceratobasidium sp. 394]|nr:hypothetical protein FRC08_005563 [Ceratobasidium sp. 394]KAG9100257.1 hypothetical protein FS749_015828 [Ceratobasidium sp. UAMH 11750]
MPDLLHELPGNWLLKVLPIVQAHLTRVAICGRPRVTAGTASGINVQDGSKCGDQSIILSYERDENNKASPVNKLQPRVVLETAHTQSLENVLRKSWSYLHESNNAIHAVIVCAFRWPYPSNIEVDIAVWTRMSCGNDEEDFPCDECPGGEHRPPPAEAVDTESDEGDPVQYNVPQDPSPSSAISTRSRTAVKTIGTDPSVKWPRTKLEGRYFNMQRSQNSTMKTIRRRDSSPLIVYRETPDPLALQSPADSLTLDVYDILRPCAQEPDMFIVDRAIDLPLKPLRDELARMVGERRLLDLSQQTVPSSATNTARRSRKCSAPPRYLDEVKRPFKKSKGEKKVFD